MMPAGSGVHIPDAPQHRHVSWLACLHRAKALKEASFLLVVPSPLDPAFTSLLCSSYRQLLGKPLIAEAQGETDPGFWLYHDAPYAVLAQNACADPAFVYANITAQRYFEYSWEEFSGLPSRLSASSGDREARDRLMAGVLRDGYVEGYRGLRESKSGRRFWIDDVTIWNLSGTDGDIQGQAALIPARSAA